MAPVGATTLSAILSVAGQIAPADLQALAARGFQSTVCRRPGGESPGLLRSQDRATAARQAGLTSL